MYLIIYYFNLKEEKQTLYYMYTPLKKSMVWNDSLYFNFKCSYLDFMWWQMQFSIRGSSDGPRCPVTLDLSRARSLTHIISTGYSAAQWIYLIPLDSETVYEDLGGQKETSRPLPDSFLV